MSIGLVGKKCGMTRVFQEDGSAVPVSVVSVEPNIVTQIKDLEKDGYIAIQVTTGTRKRSRMNKPEVGHFAKAKVEPGRGLWEFRVDSAEGVEAGQEFKVDLFEAGQYVDVTGTSKGKGFAGPVKRWNFSTQDATHGNSLSHRAHGSTGQNQSPGRVFKGKKMAGQMGNVRKTIQSLELIKVDAERGLLLIKGAIPGAPKGDVVVHRAVKKGGKA